ncbi:MAG TPA: DUF6576 domain-containing protein [Phycisphaerae bacterium]|nr:DUF6576 domain-containing protein [Phycisphaerae bacterium]
MSWRDRSYNSGGEEINAYFSNPASLLQFSLPIYQGRPTYIRLHFWFLLFALFDAVNVLRGGIPPYFIAIHIALMLLAVLLHELGHRALSRTVGGDHWEWLVWPLGGMIPPHVSRAPLPTFIANIGGIAFSLPLFGLTMAALYLLPHATVAILPMLSPFSPLLVDAAVPGSAPLTILAMCLAYFATINAAIVVINLFPCYWFDGGLLWQSILTPRFGAWKASVITAIAGMVLAVPFFLLSLFATDLFGLILWALIFSDNFNRRRALAAAGPGVMTEDDVTYNYMGGGDPGDSPRRKKTRKGALHAAQKRRKAEQLEQAKIDAILEKVHTSGLHSLSFWEKRTLKKATERQRQRDLANKR